MENYGAKELMRQLRDQMLDSGVRGIDQDGKALIGEQRVDMGGGSFRVPTDGEEAAGDIPVREEEANGR
ncbi:hypothetical protein AB0I39_28000 [Kitasatospora purpeofusca]|uniref:hypothetical protein n=1 Tax=Kitasatospora purpeofusca TaxID=67352 RepID=UPI0033D97261